MQLNVFPLPSLFWGERKAFILIETKIYKGKKQVQRRNTMLTINLDSCFGEATKGIWWNFITVSFFFDCLLKGQEIQIHVKKRTIIVFFPVFHYVDFFRLPSAPHVAGLKDERSFRSFIHTFINQRHIKHIKGPLQCVDEECVYVCVCALMWGPVFTDSSPFRGAGCGAVWHHREIWTWCVCGYEAPRWDASSCCL